MRAVQWIYQRWTATALPIAEISHLSGVHEQTLFRIQRAALDRLNRSQYTPSPAVIRSLAGVLQYGPAATNFLITHRNDDFDADELAVLVEPVKKPDPPGDGAGGAAQHRGGSCQRPPVDECPAPPTANYVTAEAVERMNSELRQELNRLRRVVADFARVGEETFKAVRLRLAESAVSGGTAHGG